MPRWSEQIWTHPGTLEQVRYRSCTPDGIAGTRLAFSASETERIVRLQDRIRSTATSPEAPAGEWMVKHAESSSSTTIEGIYPSPRRLARSAVTGEGRETEKSALRHVAATETAMRIGADQSRGPVTADDIREIHRVLMSGDPGYPHEPGAFRLTQNWIGGGAIEPTPDNAIFVSPPTEDVAALMDDLLSYINDDSELALPQSAAAHARFEHIHPFPDGNGRTGRSLIHLMWARRGLIPEDSTIPVSAYLARNKQGYFGHLAASHAAVCAGEDAAAWDGIAGLFADAAEHGCFLADVIRGHVRDIMEMWRPRLGARRRSVINQVFDALPRHPVTDAAIVAEDWGCTERRARQALRSLAAAGVLETRSLARGRRGYEATGLLDLCAAAMSDRAVNDMEHVKQYLAHPAAGRSAASSGQERSHSSTPPPALPDPVRCGKWMPIAKSRCALVPGHAGGCRSRRQR